MSFIALQCCQCSTMQVKQRKKSNNKWTCVVCNERQSARHVFAQGPMARDVRIYVQTFNMSRLYADQNRHHDNNQTLAVLPVHEEEGAESGENDYYNNTNYNNNKKKRTDWSEYVDYEPPIEEETADVNEPKIVTEMPNSLFRKPKLSTYATRLSNQNEGNGFKPVFSKRKSVNTSTIQDKETCKYQSPTISKAPTWSGNTSEEKEPKMCGWGSKSRTYPSQEIKDERTLKTMPSHLTDLSSKSAVVLSKWNNYMVQEKSEDLFENEVPFSFHEKDGKPKSFSKWDKYVTKEKDEDGASQPKGLRDISNRAWQQPYDDGIFDVSLKDEMVEDDIYPDFK